MSLAHILIDIAFFSTYCIKHKDRFLLIMASPTEIAVTLLRGESGNPEGADATSLQDLRFVK